MNLWIRSQDKEFLMKVDNINLGINVDANEPYRVFTFVGGAITSFTLGIYKTKERALEVLNEIENLFLLDIKNASYEKADLLLKMKMLPIVYEMPKE